MTSSTSSVSKLGFSLVELCVTLAVAGVLSGLALHNLPQWINQHHADTTLRSIRTAINLARHTAINHQDQVIICPNRQGQCGPRNSWHHGMLIFLDDDRSRDYSSGDVIIAQLAGIKHGRIFWRAFRNRSYLLFTGQGITDWQNGHFLYCPSDANPANARQLIVNAAGRTYPSKDTDGDGHHENIRGSALQCN
ncbi:MAG: GspH/FimT family pseudopilin [Pseudomonadales bacterium]|nr:GspH/FimT family pseudopilin [Pseudomonadales bacterium]